MAAAVPAIPFAGSNAILPLLELALAQTNNQAAFVYQLVPGESFARLAAWAGLPPADVNITPARNISRTSSVVLHQGADSDPRFQALPEFRRHHFQGVVSIPLQDSGELVGIANFCRARSVALPPRELSFLLSLSLPLGALLNGETLRDRLAQTTQQLADRKMLARAKGLLQANLGWTEEESYLHIRRLSRQNRVPMREIARLLIEEATPHAA